MTIRPWMKRVGVAAGAMCLLMTAGRANAAPLDKRIPADALIYIGWQGADPLKGAYESSNLKGVVDASTIPAYIEQQLASLKDKAAAEGPDAVEAMATAQGALSIIWRHPAALYVGPVEFPAAAAQGGQVQMPKFSVAIISQAGDDAKNLEGMLQGELAKHPTPPDVKLQVTRDGDVVIIVFGELNKTNVGTGLADSPAYQKAMSHVDADAALTMYISGKGMIETAKEAFAKAGDMPDDVRAKAPLVIEALGLNGIGEMAYSGTFDKKAWRERSFVGTSGPRTGLLGLVDGGPISDGLLAMVPADAASMNTGRLDLMKVLALVREVAGKIDPRAAGEIDRGLTSMSADLGFDVEKELIAPLGDEWVYYRAPAGGATLSMTLVQRPRDAVTLGATVGKVEDLINTKGGGRVNVEKIDGGEGIEVSALRTPEFSMAWAVRNGVLYVSNVDGAVPAIKQVEEKKASIATSPAYIAAMAELPVQKGLSINYGDPAKIYPEILRAIQMISPMLRMRGIDLPADLLPDPEKSAAFMTPGADITWSDADGFYSASVTAFPGAGIMTGQQTGQSTAVVALGAALVMPSLGRSRELATRSLDAANVRGICQAAVVWAADHNDKLPDHLGKVLAANMLSPKQLVNKRGTTTPLDMTPEMLDKSQSDYDGFCREVDAHSDWVYIGNGMSSDTDSSVVLVYEKPAGYTTDGLTLGYQDGHAEFVRWSGIRGVFEATNAYLKKKGLAEVDVEALMKNAPAQFRNMPAAGTP